ncbi:hypothetical protein [Thiorhodovibrio frisius]|uniref:PLP-dependent enzyme possibly involved in cell wall biogenesis n=1 Tax=Thiorhodovibrio frisius TaxID=631362 RepID=H8Z1X5_9GAMM|nr:hypothetical protein [Thiorhodovibrio frisius]EIC22603.1 hypothetical protein Thi970DRAFT_02877 [Thiorhodovibrio frisius]WPL20044.1 putative pyridoxal phosphate-dependent enzyme [Thiorhodovibrio frisius]
MYSNSTTQPIGGYFELELPPPRALPHNGLQGFQSARAAFLALLRAGRPNRVWLPKYICNAMLAPLMRAGMAYAWYDLTEHWQVDPAIQLQTGDWLVYVNYFGLCSKPVDDLLQRFPPEQIILDYSQAFFAPPSPQALATLYSPRKFFGVPDGGLLHSQIPVPQSTHIDQDAFARMSHLLRRLGDTPEAGYTAYQHAEHSLDDPEPKRLSPLSARILSSIDFDAVRAKRRANFQYLHSRLGADQQSFAAMKDTDIPLCYPYRSDQPGLRQALIRQRLFIATYWPEALERLAPHRANSLVNNLLPLPIDQRYGNEDMERIATAILAHR